jgi:hypothetical protein
MILKGNTMLNVYITDLSAYNNGHLIGEWISLPMDEDELSNKIKEILETGSKACGYGEIHEEYFISDYEFETDFNLLEVSEYSNPYKLNSELENFEDKNENELKQISFMVEYLNYDLEYALDNYEDVIVYENMTLKDVVEEYLDQTIDFESLPQIIASNIDYDSIINDFEISGEYTVVENDVFYYVN